ncbi:MAG TPA: M56 family metallopeptidase [Gemmatimonadaceae bacterium]
MAILCMAYFVAFGAVLGAVGLLVERSLPARASRRWLWLALITSSIALPILTAFQRSSPELSVLGHHVVAVPGATHASGAWFAGAGSAWLHCDAPNAALFVRLSWGAAALFLAWGLAGGWRAARLAGVGDEGRERPVDGARVLLTDSVGPATIGVVRPRVVVPRWVLALPENRRRYVIRHEEEHRRAHDVRLLALAALLVCLMPWNLALWWQLRRLRLAVELDCDARVVAALGSPRTYGELLLRVAEASRRGPRLQPALEGRAGMLERRLVALVGPSRLTPFGRLVSVSAAVALLVALLSIPHPAPPRGPATSGPMAAAHPAH